MCQTVQPACLAIPRGTGLNLSGFFKAERTATASTDRGVGQESIFGSEKIDFQRPAKMAVVRSIG